MKLQIQSIHFDADQKLLDFIQKKADKLETFFDRILDGEVFLRLNKDSVSKDNKVVEIKINIPGGSLFVKESAASFEAATDTAVDALKAQLKKHKEKKSGGKALDEIMLSEDVEEESVEAAD
jgi:putative sigma-54 modulation protein